MSASAEVQYAAVTDVHTHVVLLDLPSIDDPDWPVAEQDEGKTWLRLSTGRRRVVPQVAVDMRARLADMDERGIGRHVLSPMPAQIADVLVGPQACVEAARAVNDGLAGYVDEDPARLAGFGTLPVSAGLTAISTEIGRLTGDLGLAGVELSSEGFFRLVEAGSWPTVYRLLGEAGAWLFLHPQDDALERRRGVRGRLAIGGVSMLTETALVVAELFRQGTYGADSPRTLLSHGGGTIPYALARMDRLWSTTDARAELDQPPSIAFGDSFYLDTSVHDPAALALAAKTVRPGRVLFGSDYPFAVQVDPAIVAEAGLPDPAAVWWRSADEAGLAPSSHRPNPRKRPADA